jgi:uncharacterized membrane protein
MLALHSPAILAVGEELERRGRGIGFFGFAGLCCCLVVVAIIAGVVLLMRRRRSGPPPQ